MAGGSSKWAQETDPQSGRQGVAGSCQGAPAGGGLRGAGYQIFPNLAPEEAPRRSAQLVNFRTPFPPETLYKTLDGDFRKRAAGIYWAPP